MDEETGWYYRTQGQQTGPVSRSELVQAIVGGQVRRDDFVWHPSLEGWAEAGSIPVLMDGAARAAAPTPPPFPIGLEPTEVRLPPDAHKSQAGGPRTADGSDAATPDEPAYVFKDSGGLTTVLLGLIALGILTSVVSVFSNVMQLEFVQQAESGALQGASLTAWATANDERQGLVAIPYVVAIFGSIIVFCFWIPRMARNARALGATGMKISPRWAVGWFFIPIANLVMPYKAMKEIWKASNDPAAWESVKRGAVLPWWWAMFLISGALGNLEARLGFAAKTLEQIKAATSVAIVSDVAFAIACAVTLMLVRQIQAMQTAALSGAP